MLVSKDLLCTDTNMCLTLTIYLGLSSCGRKKKVQKWWIGGHKECVFTGLLERFF